jgi:hypothetical protein
MDFLGDNGDIHVRDFMNKSLDLIHFQQSLSMYVATQDRVFPHYVPNSSIKHSKSDSKDRSQEIL